ncbi:MAG: 4Fe-4S dicluster domain-containing protein [Chloroflexota bacterium]
MSPQPISVRLDNIALRVREISGQNLYLCYGCGYCAGNCPMFFAVDASPRQVIRMVLYNDADVLKVNTPWMCASCFTCTVSCPRGLDVAKIMEALRSLVLRANQDYVTLAEISADKLADVPQVALVSGFRKLTG